MLSLQKPLAFIDLETTGTNFATDRIVEIAILRVAVDGTRQVKRKLINPEMPIPQGATDIHGISDEMVKDTSRSLIIFEFRESIFCFIVFSVASMSWRIPIDSFFNNILYTSSIFLT